MIFNDLYVREVSRLAQLLGFVKPLCKQPLCKPLLLALFDNVRLTIESTKPKNASSWTCFNLAHLLSAAFVV
jgi:hypothetical protein